jgi:hypothetical protein
MQLQPEQCTAEPAADDNDGFFLDYHRRQFPMPMRRRGSGTFYGIAIRELQIGEVAA